MMLTRNEKIAWLTVVIGLITLVIFYSPTEKNVSESLGVSSVERQTVPSRGVYFAGSPINLEQIPAAQVPDLYFGELNGKTITYLPEDEQRVVTYRGNEISYASFYPDRSELGFYYISTTTPETLHLIILDTKNGKFKEIYKDDYRFSSWNWNEFDTVTVRRSCGTQCIRAKMFNFKTGKTIVEYFEF